MSILFSKHDKGAVPSASDALSKLADELNKEFKAEVALPGEKMVHSDKATKRIPTSSLMLNCLLGGGTPLGRVVELSGDPSEGKSTLSEHMMVGFQKFPGISILLDAESGWNRDRALRIGHNSSRHLHLLADTVELGFSVIDSTIKRMRMPGSKFPLDMPLGFFWDTISASQTETEKSGDIYADGMMDKPRKIRRALRTLSLVLPATNCSLIFINQTIQGPNKHGASSTPGGGAIKFWSSKRLKVWSHEKMHYPEDNTGIITSIKTIKDKLNPPYREIQVPIRFSDGVDNLYEVMNFLVDNSNYVNMSGGRVTILGFPDPDSEAKFWHKKAYEYYAQHPELLEYLQMCAQEVWDEKFPSSGVATPLVGVTK
jgi:recombination protein RecA